jgi:hypothetical protein
MYPDVQARVRLYACGWAMVGLRGIDEPVRLSARLGEERLKDSPKFDAGSQLVKASAWVGIADSSSHLCLRNDKGRPVRGLQALVNSSSWAANDIWWRSYKRPLVFRLPIAAYILRSTRSSSSSGSSVFFVPHLACEDGIAYCRGEYRARKP